MTGLHANACPECGATGRFGDCAQLFQTLLALDHQRLQPWGEFHGLNVACYLLQHPSQAEHGGDVEHLELVTTFLERGLAAVKRWERERVGLNRRHRLRASERQVPARVHRAIFTIEDLSVDGTFPGGDYAERMSRWAGSVIQERALGHGPIAGLSRSHESVDVTHLRSKSVGGR